MYIKQATVNNQVGLHARPATFFIQKANEFKSTIWVEKDDEQVNGKSIMGLMMLAAGHGAKLTVTAEGSDAEDAIRELGTLIKNGFEDAE